MTPADRRLRHLARTLLVHTLGESPARRVTVERRDGKPVALPWDDLYAIVSDALGDDVFAVEVFPARHALVDETNRRHFFEIADPAVLPGLHRRGR